MERRSLGDSIFTGLRWSQVTLVASYWMRFSLRSGGGLMALLTFVITGLMVGAVFVTPIENLMNESNELGHTGQEAVEYVNELAESDQFVEVVTFVTGSTEAEAHYLLRDNPAILSAIFVILLICFPYVTSIAAFNQTSGDIRNRGLRYLLLRTERPNIFLGRFLGTTYFITISMAVVVVLLSLYIGLKFGIYPMGDMMGWSAQGFVAFLLLTLPYIAMCAWISGLLDSPFGSLTLCLLTTGFPILLFKTADDTIAADLEWLTRLLPWGWKADLLSGDLQTRLIGCGMMLVFTGFFLFLGLTSFRKRDL